MKNFTVFFVAISFSMLLSAQDIVQGTLKMFKYGTPGTPEYYERYGLDFNNDGLVEFYIQNDYSINDSAYITIGSSEETVSFNNNILTQGEYLDQDKVEALLLNDIIGKTPSKGGWHSAGDANLCDLESGESYLVGDHDNYVGFKFSYSVESSFDENTNDEVFYGWAKVTVSGNTASGYTFIWTEAYYDKTGAAIKAGDKGAVPMCDTITGLSGVVNADKTATATWTAVDGALAYNVYLNNEKVDSTTSTTITSPVLIPGDYTLKIKTACFKSESEFSSVLNFTIEGDENCDTVTNVSVEINEGNTLFVEWTDIAGAEGFIIRIDGDVVDTVKNDNLFVSEPLSNGQHCVSIGTICNSESISAFTSSYCATIVGVEDYKNEYTIYPNPVNDILNIVANEKINTVEIISISGQVIETILVDSDNVKIKVSDIDSGSYFVKITTDKLISTKRIYIR